MSPSRSLVSHPRKTKRTPVKQWPSTAINGARPLRGGNIGENISDTPMIETLQPHRLPLPLQTAICLVGCGLAVSVGAQAGCGNSDDDPRVGAPQNDEMSPSRSLGSHPRKRTLGKQWPSTAHAPKETSSDTPMVETLQPHRFMGLPDVRVRVN